MFFLYNKEFLLLFANIINNNKNNRMRFLLLKPNLNSKTKFKRVLYIKTKFKRVLYIKKVLYIKIKFK